MSSYNGAAHQIGSVFPSMCNANLLNPDLWSSRQGMQEMYHGAADIYQGGKTINKMRHRPRDLEEYEGLSRR